MINRIKENKNRLVAASIVILLPVIVGLLLWKRLPDPMPTHFNVHNEADGWSSKVFAVFGLPAFLLLVHWVCVLASSYDKYNAGQHHKVFNLVYWICPAVSLLTNGIMYSFALGYTWDIDRIILPLMGVLFIVIGNYLPKCKPNRTIGIKLPWTFASEDNWRATHRFGGKVWVIGGGALLLCMFLPSQVMIWVLLAAILTMVLIPTVYSYLYYRKHEKE